MRGRGVVSREEIGLARTGMGVGGIGRGREGGLAVVGEAVGVDVADFMSEVEVGVVVGSAVEVEEVLL